MKTNYWEWVPTSPEEPALLFDIETDGLLDTVSVVHSNVIKDIQTGQVYSAHDHEGSKVSIEQSLEILEKAPLIVGHNIIKYDIPAIQIVYPGWEPRGRVIDTLVCSRLIWPDLKDSDFRLARKNKLFPKKLIGSHSLEAWGYRLGNFKDDFGKTTDWKNWSPEMQEYCEQDVEVTEALYRHILNQRYSSEAIALEHEFQRVIWLQEASGFPFDLEAAHDLYAELAAKRQELEDGLQEAFPPKVIEEEFVPKANNRKRGYIKGVPIIRRKEIPFNPGSRKQVAERLIENFGWEPEEYTPTGQPIVSEEVLNHLDYPEAKLIADYYLVQKRLGQLAEGKAAWLKLERNGRIHGTVITNGAVTGRCTHNSPNVAQVPSVGVPYGEQCRALFHAPKGYVLMGCDASGLELRCLGHYMARYDGGAYIDVILNGDIHWANTQALGLVADGEERDEENEHHNWARNKVAKRFIYAFLYGAGDELLGSLLEPDATPQRKKKLGAKLRKTFLSKTPALKRLVENVQNTAKKRGYLRGLDGRRLRVRSLHSALNTLLQSAGAIIMKEATVFLDWKLTRDPHQFEAGYMKDFWNAAHVHDEYQIICREEIGDTVGMAGVQAIRDAGTHLGFRCPLDGEYKLGRNWAETH